MTNEELQTLIKNACKAAGWRVKKTLHASVVSVWIDGAPYVVKLADDDGDSRALQVACKIALAFAQTEDGKWCAEAYSPLDEKSGGCYSACEACKDDDRKAARMAVLRCAAMVGEAMK